MRFDTLAVHAGTPSYAFDGAHPTAPPIVQASSYWYASADELDRVLGDEQPGFSYARYASPTVVAFEEAVAALEGAPEAVAFGSGMAAIHAVARACAPRPDAVLFVSQDCYGGTSTPLAGNLTREGGCVRFVGGIVACATREQAAGLRTWRKYTGAVLGASDAYLALRGVRTLPLRMARQCSNAQALAEALARHPAVERVYYPGLTDSP